MEKIEVALITTKIYDIDGIEELRNEINLPLLDSKRDAANLFAEEIEFMLFPFKDHLSSYLSIIRQHHPEIVDQDFKLIEDFLWSGGFQSLIKKIIKVRSIRVSDNTGEILWSGEYKDAR